MFNNQGLTFNAPPLVSASLAVVFVLGGILLTYGAIGLADLKRKSYTI